MDISSEDEEAQPTIELAKGYKPEWHAANVAQPREEAPPSVSKPPARRDEDRGQPSRPSERRRSSHDEERRQR